MPDPTPDAIDKWQSHRRALRRWWWFYVVIAVVGVLWFFRNLSVGEPNVFAVLLLIPLIALRQAWKTDRQIVECDRRMREMTDAPTMAGHT